MNRHPIRAVIVVLCLLLATAFSVTAQPPTPSPAPDEDDPNGLTLAWEQIEAQPDDFAVACMPLNNPVQTVLYNATAPFPLASVSKLLIFIEYAQRLDRGEIALEEQVSVAVLNRYNLPRTDRGAHDRFIERYPDGTRSLPLWEVATQGMIQYSSNAATDYLLDRLSPVDWAALYGSLALLDTTYPHSFTMIPLLMNNHENGQAEIADLPTLSTPLGERYLDLYLENDYWREQEVAYRAEQRRQFPDWPVQSTILQDFTAVGSANDFRNILRAIYTEDSPFTPNTRYIVRTALQWQDNAFVNNNYIEYGSKLGFYSGGTLTLVAYGHPLDGDPVITVTFFRNIPPFRYYDMLREDSVGDLAHWMNVNGCAGVQAELDTVLAAGG